MPPAATVWLDMKSSPSEVASCWWINCDETQERLLPRVHLAPGDRARLHLGVLGSAAHFLVLQVDRATRALQLLALQEETDDEPQEGERRERPFEEAADRRRPLFDEVTEADDVHDVVELHRDPERR